MPAVPQVLLAHPGTQHAFQLARELYRRDYLGRFYTCLGLSSESNAARSLWPVAKLFKIERQWQNRIVEGVPAEKLRCYPQLEIEAWWRTRNHAAARGALRVRNERFQRLIPNDAIASSEVVIGFDTSSHILGDRAKTLGKRFILDRSIGHPRYYGRMIERLAGLFPEWEDTYESKSENDLSLEDEEHRLADLIVVPSRFVAKTLLDYGVPGEKIRKNPFGTDVTKFYPSSGLSRISPLIFLFLGALTARKGLPLLLDAWKAISPKNAELWIGGGGHVPRKERVDSHRSIRWLGPISREALPVVFRRAHIFVCPSFFEGLAQVQVEAAACGLPVIATTGSGGDEIIEEGVNGYVIKAGNLEQLVESLTRFIERPVLVRDMREHAMNRCRTLSWSAYGDRWQQILKESD